MQHLNYDCQSPGQGSNCSPTQEKSQASPLRPVLFGRVTGAAQFLFNTLALHYPRLKQGNNTTWGTHTVKRLDGLCSSPWKIQSDIIWNLQTDVKLYEHGNTHMSHHVAPRQNPLMNKKERIASLLKMEPISCPETSVTDYQLTLRNIPEERRLHLHRGWSLKLRIPILYSDGNYLFDRQCKWRQTWISNAHKICSPCYPGCWTESTDAQITQVLFWNKIIRLVFKINSNLISKLQFDDNSLLLHLFITLTIWVKLCCP